MIVLRELSNRLPGVVSLIHDADLYSCASNDWLAKTTAWINYDALWLFAREVSPNARVETRGYFTAPLDSFEVCFEDLAQRGLSWARCLEELIRVRLSSAISQGQGRPLPAPSQRGLRSS